MTDSTSDEGRLVRFLLGLLPEEERARIEQAYFGDDQYYEQLLAIEDELAYRWLAGSLSRDERRQYEFRYLRSGRDRAKTGFARALLRMASRQEGGDRPGGGWFRWPAGWMAAWQAALSAAAVVAVAASLAMLVETRDLRSQLAALRSERKAPAAAVVPEQARVEAPPAISFLLAPGTTRGSDELRRLRIPASGGLVRMELSLKKGIGFQRFRAALRTADGVEAMSQSGLTATGTSVVWSLPAGVFTNDEFVLVLQGLAADGSLEDAGEYHFSVGR